jgi:hypothetical protein
VTVKAGAGIELVCLTEPRDGTDVRWRLNGSPFTSDLTRGIMVRVGQLQITNVTTSLAGSYDCVANNSRGAVISQPADVRIAGWSSVIHCLIGFPLETGSASVLGSCASVARDGIICLCCTLLCSVSTFLLRSLALLSL